ncbi:hypothetical protein HYH02_004027 [Chlamydomonas schloesseri]|uniref:Uncharacterized protein n=1 Tax=Chlamydomonas schloesseri TaxID=2026947 RepID=A0A835WQE1_9CHLO|nr:hypothetical protein HYH02_004027 [Chlamydomonas schloesseri]|eukprot:KAG2451428.1 hypothetical protein HYH02_004027 [Chlamydomonas schloesseri]
MPANQDTSAIIGVATWALPSQCAPPPPLGHPQQQPNTVRVAGGVAPSSAAGPLGSPHHERFNLVLPASFVECNFVLNTVLQRGVTVAFRIASGPGPASTSASAAAAAGASSGTIVARVHGHVQCHVNPLGLATYRVSGPQPAAVCGCSLLRWAAEDGSTLVIELLAPRPQPQQAPAPVAARRLFGDCLPSPATIRKEPIARTRALAEQRHHHHQPSPLKSLEQQPSQQAAAAAAAPGAAAGYQLPAPLPFALSLAAELKSTSSENQQVSLPAPPQPQQSAAAPACTAAAPITAATAFVVQQAAAMEILAPQQQPASEAKQEAQLPSHSSDPGPRAAAAPRAPRSRAAVGAHTQQPQQQQPAAVVRSKRLADKAAAAAAAASVMSAEPAPHAAAAPKRHRRTASADVDAAAAGASDSMEAELAALSVDEQHVDELSGIELLLAAHAVISRQELEQGRGQEPAGRPKRMRLLKTLSL